MPCPFSADTTIATLMARVGKPVEVPDALGPLQKPLARAGLPDAADRPDAGELAVALMACAEGLSRPAPLPLVTAAPIVDLTTATEPDPDATMLGAALAGSRLAEPGEETALDDAPLAAPTAPPDYLDDDLVVESDDSHRRRRWPWVLVALVLSVLVGTAAAFAWNGVRTPSYEVPDLTGMTEEEARAAVADYDFEIETRETRRDGSTPGEVLETDPAAGAQLDEGGTLVLFVSLGNTPAEVPTNLVGMTVDQANQALDAAGGFKSEVTEVESEEVAAGHVISLGPDVPAELPKGSTVPLIVSTGPAPRTIPGGLEGKTYEDAVAALDAVQLKAVKVEEFSDDVEAGRIITLRPAAGTAVPRGSEVEVVVSKGPDLVVVPPVQGLSLEEAVQALEAAGLVVGDAFGPAKGDPFLTDPSAGTEVRRGATVDIYLRR